METPQEIFDRSAARVAAEPRRTRRAEGVYQFDVQGEHGGTWTVVIGEGCADVSRRATERPDVTVRMEERDFVDMFTGRLNGGLAFLQGRISVRGNIGKAMRLADVFGP